MKDSVRQYVIAMTNLFACAALTVITPFYPAVAERAGIPSLLIGFILSLFPITSIIVSLFLPKIMFRIGRNLTLILGLVLISAGCILISIIEHLSPPLAITISIISRILTGSGGACEAIASTSILSSDYPEEFQRLAAIIEVFTGLGIVIGPLAGSVLFSFGGFAVSCSAIGFFVISYIPVIFCVLGKSREYIIEEKVKISIWELGKKPKILLNFFMGFSILFAIGVTMPTMEPHLLNYGIQEEYVGYWFIINTGAYLISSILMTYSNNLPKKETMFFGLCLLIVGTFLLGPCPSIFSRNLVIVGIGHHIMGWSGAFIFSISYLVPLIPYLIDISHTEYNIPKDDRLNDSISSIVNISISCGEIAGPIFGSLIPQLFEKNLKYRMTFTITSFIFVGYALIYLVFDKIFTRRERKIIVNQVIEEEMIPYINNK